MNTPIIAVIIVIVVALIVGSASPAPRSVRLIADFSCDLNVRFGPEADISAVLIYVRFTPKSGHRQVHGREAREFDQTAKSSVI
jgi:hypothetical protein